MEGYFFLVSSWIVIILIFFFLDGRISPVFAVHLLVSIILSQYFIPIGLQQLNATIIYIAVVACFYMGQMRLKNTMQVLLLSFVLALCQSGYYLFHMLEPMWFMWLPSWMDNILLVYLTIMLTRAMEQRIISLIMGMVISDLFLFFSHVRSGLYYNLYSLDWLDETAICCILLLGWKVLEMTSKYFYEQTKHLHKKEV